MTPQREPDAAELAMRSDGTAPAGSADGDDASVTEPELAVKIPRPTASPDLGGLPDGRPWRRRIVLVGVLVLVLGAAGVGGYVLLGGDRSAGSDAGSATAVTTAVVSRTTLVDTEQEDGALGYDDEQTLRFGVRGVLTSLPEEGATVRRGQTLYRVGNQPVTLWYGKLPVYRTLTDGIDDGTDVAQLEANLDELG